MASLTHAPREGRVLKAALRYAAAGYPVFPCRSNKKPHITDWSRNATTDEKKIRQWFAKWPRAMIGMPCGARSGVVVIDADMYRPECGESLDELENECGILPGTVTAKTGSGGFHWYLRHPGFPVSGGANKLGKRIDLLADGKFVVLPPSRGDKGAYRWVDGMELVGGEIEIAFAPTTLLARFKLRNERRRRPEDGSVSPLSGDKGRDLHYLGEPSAFARFSGAPRVLERPLDARTMRDLLGDQGVVERLAEVVARGWRHLDFFLCTIPGHREKGPSAGIAPGDNGVHVYHCRHGRSRLLHKGEPRSIFLLGEVFAFQAARSEFEMNPAELWVWSIRLLIEAGVIAPADTSDVAALPGDAPSHAHAAWESFRGLLACRRLYAPTSPSPFARRFLIRWDRRLSEHGARLGIEWLIRHRYLIEVVARKRTPLFMASDGTGRILSPSGGPERDEAPDELIYVRDLTRVGPDAVSSASDLSPSPREE